MILNGAQANGQSIVPEGWWQDATTKQADTGLPGRGYGYQRWANDDGSYAARGIFGQSIFIDPQRELVIVANANWAGGARGPQGHRSAGSVLLGSAGGRGWGSSWKQTLA